MNRNAHVENVGGAVILTADVLWTEDIIGLANELADELDVQHSAIFFCDAPTKTILRRLKTPNLEWLCGGPTWGGDILGHEVRLREDLLANAEGKYTVIFASRAYAERQGWIEKKSINEHPSFGSWWHGVGNECLPSKEEALVAFSAGYRAAHEGK